MYTLEQAERLAADFLRQLSADWDNEVTLFEEDECKAKKGEFFYFAFQSVKYVTTRDQKYFLYGPCQISVHGVTGECRLLSLQESHAVDPFNRRQGQATRPDDGGLTLKQAERLAADFLRRESFGSDHEAVLVDNDSYKREKGDYFYFTYNSAKYLATGDDRYALYGAPALAVHKVSGACRWVSMQEYVAVDPFNSRQ